MTKADLIVVIADRLKFPWACAELLVDVVFDCIEQSMSRGEKIEIRGFGSFTVRQYRAYDGRTPRTGAIVPVKPKRLAVFKVGKELRERVNDGRRSTKVLGAPEPAKLGWSGTANTCLGNSVLTPRETHIIGEVGSSAIWPSVVWPIESRYQLFQKRGYP